MIKPTVIGPIVWVFPEWCPWPTMAMCISTVNQARLVLLASRLASKAIEAGQSCAKIRADVAALFRGPQEEKKAEADGSTL